MPRRSQTQPRHLPLLCHQPLWRCREWGRPLPLLSAPIPWRDGVPGWDPSCHGHKDAPGWLSSVRASVDSKGFQGCDKETQIIIKIKQITASAPLHPSQHRQTINSLISRGAPNLPPPLCEMETQMWSILEAQGINGFPHLFTQCTKQG